MNAHEKKNIKELKAEYDFLERRIARFRDSIKTMEKQQMEIVRQRMTLKYIGKEIQEG